MAGETGLDETRRDETWQGRRGETRRDETWQVGARLGRTWQAWPDQTCFDAARRDATRLGEARHGRLG